MLPATLFLEYARIGAGARYFEAYTARRRIIRGPRLSDPSPVELHLLFRDPPEVHAETGTLRSVCAVITFEPRPAWLEVELISLDDPTLSSNWDHDRLWRARAGYPDGVVGSVRMTVTRPERELLELRTPVTSRSLRAGPEGQ